MAGAASTLPPGPARQVRRWRAWRVVWRLHRWLGLGGGALLVLLSASGALLVVHHELERRLERDRRVAPPAPERPAAPPPLAATARAIAPLAPAGSRLYRVRPARGPDATHQFVFLAADGSTRWSAFVDPATGRMLWSGPDQSLFTPWLLHLHMYFHAGRAGAFVAFLGGVALTLLAATGLFIHRDRLAGLARHPFRLGLGWRVALTDLHKWFGLVLIYFPLVLGVTGALYSLSVLRARPAAPPAKAFDLAQLAPIEPMLATARERFPGSEMLRAQLPAGAGGPVTVLLLHRAAPVWQKFSRIEFDAATGALRAVHAAADASAAAQFAAMLAPLHFGFYGAPWVKWAYFAGGLAPALLALSGAAIGLLRRRRLRSALAAAPMAKAGVGVAQENREPIRA